VQALSRLFISHSSLNDDWALALQAWLIREGWSGEEDIFLDLDPERDPPFDFLRVLTWVDCLRSMCAKSKLTCGYIIDDSVCDGNWLIWVGSRGERDL
jgi:hypothetical protein